MKHNHVPRSTQERLVATRLEHYLRITNDMVMAPWDTMLSSRADIAWESYQSAKSRLDWMVQHHIH